MINKMIFLKLIFNILLLCVEDVSMDEKHFIDIALEIVEMTDSAIGVTGRIAELSLGDFAMLKNWYEDKTGLKMVIPQDSLKVRKCLIDYLKSKNIDVPKDPKYDIDKKTIINSNEFFHNWESEGKNPSINKR